MDHVLFDDKPLGEHELPDEADLAEAESEDSGLRLVRCPACRELIHEDAPQCPCCRQWIVDGGSQWRRSRKWYVRAGLLLARTLLWNWLFWLAVTAVAAAVAAWRILK